MKNKSFIIILVVFITNFTFYNIAYSEKFFSFDVSEIEILNNGQKIVGTKRGIISSNLGEKIEGDEFEYDKSKNILKVNGNIIIEAVDGLRIKSDIIQYDKTKNIILAEGNIVIYHNKKNYKIFSDTISYFKNEEKIVTNGKTEVLVGADYKIETEELVFYKDKLIIESTTQSKFFNYTEQIFLNIKKFVYSLNKQELKAQKIVLIRDYKNPLNEKYYFESGIFNFKDKTYLTKDINIEFKKDTFGNKDNDPRLKGVSSSSKNGITTINKGIFTSCKKTENCSPWSIKAEKVTHDKNKKQITYDNAVLRIYDKPVFYFPKFFHPDPTVKRQSGFLAPRLSNSNILGSSLRVPYYLAISESKDMTFSPTLFSKNIQMIQTEYRHQYLNSSLITDFNLVNGYKSKNDNKKNLITHFFSKFKSNLNLKSFERSSFNLDFYKVNKDTYLKLFDKNLSNSELKPENPDLLSSQVKLDLEHSNYNLTTGFNSYESLKKSNSDRYEFVLPYYNFSTNFFEESNLGILNFLSTGDNILKDTNNLRSRMINDINYESFDYISENGLKNNINFTLKNLIASGNNNNEYDSSPEIKLMGLFESQTSFPMISKTLDNINYFNPKISFRFNPSDMSDHSADNRRIYNNNLFDLNRLGFADTLEAGKSLTLGIDYKKEKIDDINKFFELKLGTIYRDENINEIPNNSTINKKKSNIIGTINNNFSKNISLNYEFSADNNLDKVDYNSIGTTLSLNNFVTSFNYVEENGKIGSTNFIENNTLYNFNDKSFVRFRTRKNREIDLTEYYDLIYEYKNDCLVAGIKYNKTYYRDRDLAPSEDLMFTIKLIPLTSFEQGIGK